MCELDIIAIWSVGGTAIGLLIYSLFRKHKKSKKETSANPAPNENKDSALVK